MCWGACSVALVLSHSVRLWTVVDKAPQSMGIFQERILDWVAMPSSWGSSQPRDGTQVSMSPALAGGFFATELLGKPLYIGLEHISLGLKNYIPICSSQYLSVYTYICCSVTKSCLTLCQPMDCSMPGLPVPHYLPEFAKVYVHWVGDTIQPSHPVALFSFFFQFFQSSIHICCYCCCCVQSPSHVQLFVTPWTAACQGSMFLTIFWSLPKFMSIELVMPSNHLILPSPVLNFPSIRIFSKKSALCIRWPKYWSFSFSISPFNEYLGLISYEIDWFDLPDGQETLKRLIQHHSSKVSILQCSAFFFGPTLISVLDY